MPEVIKTTEIVLQWVEVQKMLKNEIRQETEFLAEHGLSIADVDGLHICVEKNSMYLPFPRVSCFTTRG